MKKIDELFRIINLPRFNRKTPKSPYASSTLEYVALIASFSADATKKEVLG